MGPGTTQKPGSAGGRRDPVRGVLAPLLAALVCLVLALAVEARAQTTWPDIASVQERLVELGYDAGAADGLLGPKTRAALRAFQADRDLPVNGRPDETTLRALFGKAPSGTAAAAPAPSGEPPRLDAVPLKPVEAAPLAPLAGPDPHGGLPAEGASPSAGPGAIATSLPEDQGSTLSRAENTSDSVPWDRWIIWVAVALAALGAVAFVATARTKTPQQETAGDRTPQPLAARAAARPSAVRGGHVFGVDVPPMADGEPD